MSDDLDPLLAALVEKLPRGRRASFSADERRQWLETMAIAFRLVYGGPVVGVPDA